jgi:DHA1 family quinolone resistance protein-like MFS transporter
MNRVIKLLIFSDIFVLTGFGLIDPIISIFIKDSLIGGSLLAAGTASTIFIIVKSILQVPLARYADKYEQRLFFLLVGSSILILVPLFYAFSTHIYQIYLAQLIHGAGAALVYPTWMGLFSANLDKKKESFEWAVYETCVGVGTALAAYTGAIMAFSIGFKNLFLLVGLFLFIGVLILLFLDKGKKVGINYRYVIYKEPQK